MTLSRLTIRLGTISRFLSNSSTKNGQNKSSSCLASRIYAVRGIPQHSKKKDCISRNVSSNKSERINDIGLKNGHGNSVIVFTGILGITGAIIYIKSLKNKQNATECVQAGYPIAGLPNYTTDEVKIHNNKHARIWMTYKNGVYDVTEYIGDHPGGLSIILSAGVSLEPFFSIYNLHYHEFVLKKLEKFRIGNIYDKSAEESNGNPFENEPSRDPGFLPRSVKPFNAEHKLSQLTKTFLTPNDHFFIRNHFPVPSVSEEDYRLHICKQDLDKPFILSLERLKKKFPKVSVVSTIQCVENRRIEMKNVKRVFGLKWGPGAIGNSKWAGACLDDVLRDVGIDIEKESFAHIYFEGIDKDPSGTHYTASVPVELARRFKREIILAYEMNDEELSRDHGYPIRVVLPGFSGARQVKWLHKIRFDGKESDYHWQYHYKPFLSSVTWTDAKFDLLPAIQDMPVQSAICQPSNDFEIEEGVHEINASGYAWSGGGRAIISVELSIDGGKTWNPAKLKSSNQDNGKAFAWILWEAVIEIPKDASDKIEIICRAVDSSLNEQPEKVEGIWNFCGVLNNAWHSVNIYVPEKKNTI